MRASKKTKHFLLFLIFNLFLVLQKAIPFKLGLTLCAKISSFIFPFFKKEVARANSNLDIAFKGRLTEDEKVNIIKKMSENIGMTFYEGVNIEKIISNKGYIESDGLGNLSKAINKGKGVIAIAGHIANWEALAIKVAISGFPVNVVAREVRNSFFNQYLISLREKYGVNTIIRGEKTSTRKIISAFKNNEIIALLIDQDISAVQGVFVDFFGTPAFTPVAAASLARKFNSPVVAAYTVREKEFGIKVVISDELPVTITGNDELDDIRNTGFFTKTIEDIIRQRPEQWVWWHDRWKSREE